MTLHPPEPDAATGTADHRYPDGVVNAQVIDVELERERELRVTYDDDVTCTFPLLALRRACPCATCRGRRDADQPAYAGTSIAARGAEMHGNWGISIDWSDGHSTGIYPWTHLRSWWDEDLDGQYALPG